MSKNRDYCTSNNNKVLKKSENYKDNYLHIFLNGISLIEMSDNEHSGIEVCRHISEHFVWTNCKQNTSLCDMTPTPENSLPTPSLSSLDFPVEYQCTLHRCGGKQTDRETDNQTDRQQRIA